MKKIYDKVIKEYKNIKNDKKYEIEIMEKAIDKVCNKKVVELNQLYIETIKLGELQFISSMVFSLFAFMISVFNLFINSIDENIRIITKYAPKLDFINDIPYIFIAVVIVIIIGVFIFALTKDWEKYKYKHYILQIIKKKYSKVVAL